MEESRKVTVEEARASFDKQVSILWRPDETLSEENQYCVISNEN